MLTTCLLSLAALTAQDDLGVARHTFPLDPVELQAGREVPGDSELELERFGFTYRFAAPANREAFAADPARYEARMGGACARMGPLSGLGTAQIWTVHGGGLYFFASEACKRGFLEAPETLIEVDEMPPPLSPPAVEAGRALLAQALEALGGAAAIDAVRTFRAVREERGPEQDGELERRTTVSVRFPDGFRRLEELPAQDYTFGYLANADGAWTLGGEGGPEPLHPARREAFLREMQQHPLVLLRARGAPGVSAMPAGEGLEDGRAVRYVTLHHLRRGWTLGLDAEDGTPRSLAFRGRGPGARVGEVKLVFGDYGAVDGLRLPRSTRTVFEGQPWGGTRRWDHLELDPELAPGELEPR